MPIGEKKVTGSYILCVDLEATCSDTDQFPRSEMEIIEIGAVVVNSQFEPIAEFESFVKPVRNPILTAFCTDLTTIIQSQVDSAQEFPCVWNEFQTWLSRFDDCTWCSWGDYDRNQFAGNLNFSNINGDEFLNRHHNAKKIFTKNQGMRSRVGLKAAVTKFAGLEWSGTHHRGIDDARNLAKLMPFVFGAKKIKI